MPDASSPGVKPGCPFCPSNGMVQIINTSTCGRYYLVKVVNATPNEHYFITPVRHMEHFMSLDADWFGALQELIVHVPWYSEEAALNLAINQYSLAGQRVPHTHCWIVCRQDGSGGGLGTAGLVAEFDKSHPPATAQQPVNTH